MSKPLSKLATVIVVSILLIGPVMALVSMAAPTGGLVKVKSDTEMLGVSDLHGGGHLTWIISGEAAQELRAMVHRRYDTNGIPGLQAPEVRGGSPRSYLMDVETLLENDVVYAGADIRGTAPLHSQQNEELDVRLADELAGACKVLLRMYDGFDEHARAAVVGAVRYFVTSRDADNDLRSAHGFDDDVKVVNHVIEVTGSGITPIRTG